MAYAVVMASCKLQRYFDDHEIIVPTQFPIRDALENDKAPNRVLKWATELAQYNIKFMARKAVKSGVLAEFIAEWTPQGTCPETDVEVVTELVWTIFIDGAKELLRAGCVAVITSSSGRKLRYSARLDFPTTNNPTEYEGILLGLRQANVLGARRKIIYSDSQLAACQLAKDYQARDPEMAKYLLKAVSYTHLTLPTNVNV